MKKEQLALMRDGYLTAFVNGDVSSNLAYKPQFVSNNYKEGRKVISTIEDELLNCEEFSISVAFITMSGITPLLQTLKELEKRGIKGRILTTDYLTFSEPKALKTLAKLNNIDLKMFHTEEAGAGFHTKGYIFRQDEIYRIIVGSSNLTLSALTTNKEWNTKIVSTEHGEFTREILNEFDSLWNGTCTKTYEEFIEQYTEIYTKNKIIQKQKEIARKNTIVSLEEYRLKPNSMQTKFIMNLQKIREAGEKRALLISATGTGKTYASAFALREQNPKKALFLVHREQIAKQAKRSFEKVFGTTKSMGLLSGNEKNYDADFLFSTMQMMARDDILKRFAPEEFETIIIDEVHRAGADSYQRIIDYFQPKFLLGMTASPERTDNYDIFALFDHNIAYEIRLQQALEDDLLCPFHYFGITDLEIEGEIFDDTTGVSNFSHLVCDDRVDYILEQINYYGYCGNRVKGLVFCSSKEEAKELSKKFNDRGYHTAVLTGEDSQARREEYIGYLTSEDENHLDYIFTIDIFNEGVDIPEINQVVMLRPTQSPIVFVQQLGRGLRKSEDKEYVVILDFIGNYMNNFMIPIALSGDRTYNKDNIRKYVREGVRIIPGSSSIHFDEISRKRIYESIDKANFSQVKLIRENYNNLKNKLGCIPALMDFDEYGEMDVLRIFDNKSLGSYYKFLVKYEKDYKIRLTKEEEKVVEYISQKFASGKRIHELELLNRMLYYQHGLMGSLKDSLSRNYEIHLSKNAIENIVNIMTNQFATGSGKKTYEKCIFLEKENNDYMISNSFSKMLENEDFYCIIKELIEFGISRYRNNYSETYQDTDLVLYKKYTYEDACRLLNWETNEVPLNIGGYKFDKKTRTFPVFINYEKTQDISDTIKYEDHFVNADTLIAISKSGRSLQSEDVQNFLHAVERNIDVHL
ncbi:MAG: DEAD/DEAH box helicase, partial [Lachnospiraceae bacterium]|nr:DEAD/DEAH box helicase [Lachnospiraceae bacterium]